MDPNQERRDECKVCGGFLPKRKAKFCSRFCQRRFQRRKRTPNVGEFYAAITDVTWIDAEKRPEVNLVNGIYHVKGKVMLVRARRVVAFGPEVQEDEVSIVKRLAEERKGALIVARRNERIVMREDEKRAKAYRKSLEATG